MYSYPNDHVTCKLVFESNLQTYLNNSLKIVSFHFWWFMFLTDMNKKSTVYTTRPPLTF